MLGNVSAAALLFALVTAVSCGGAKDNSQKPAVNRPAPPKITQFYASAGTVAKGEQVLLCYGVENATAVRIDHGVEPIKPAFNRCIQVTPAGSTTYTLTAEGEGGTATASLSVNVVRGAKPKAAPAQAAQSAPETNGPVIRSFRRESKPGLILLCYEVEGAEAVAIEPQVLPRGGALRGCLGVAPKGPTTYTLTAYGNGGKTVHRTLEVTP